MNQTLIFFKIVPLAFNAHIPVIFWGFVDIGRNAFEAPLFIWRKVVLLFCFFNVLHMIGKFHMELGLGSIEGAVLAQSCVSLKILVENIGFAYIKN